MTPRRRPLLAVALTASVALAACGTGSDDAADTADSVVTETQPEVTDSSAEPADDAADDDEGNASADEAAAPATQAPDDESVPASEPVSEPESDDAVEAADGSETPATDAPVDTRAPAPAPGGRALAFEIDDVSRFEGNPFPDLVVEDVGREIQVNLANILPSDRPVLLWAWAPH